MRCHRLRQGREATLRSHAAAGLPVMKLVEPIVAIPNVAASLQFVEKAFG